MGQKASKGNLKAGKRALPSQSKKGYQAVTPFELAQTAIALCRLRKEEFPNASPDPASCFDLASALLTDAEGYLDRDTETDSSVL